ncbi:MAG TPA: DUF1592 domain-containing protein [Bryobacteraceae bacterium]|nr:DUF1592 domain-containing protein [Bryobacteraceae bacterium]
MLSPRLPLVLRRSCQIAVIAVLTIPLSFAQRRALLDNYCMACHNDKLRTAGVSVQSLNAADVSQQAETWEKVLRKLTTAQMPPPGLPRPDDASRNQFTGWLETSLDRAASDKPNPGHPTIHRLNRAEYSNAIRDLLALDINAGSMLPADDSGYGFDNIGDVLSLSPGLLERYMSAARKVSRLAVGSAGFRPQTDSYAVTRGAAQADQVSEDLPLGSRGGIAVHHYFPVDGDYMLRVQMRPKSGDNDDKPHFDVPYHVTAGSHLVGVTFLNDSTKQEAVLPPRLARGASPGPLLASTVDLRVDDARVQMFDISWRNPAIDSLSITGPGVNQHVGDTLSREKIFVCHPANAQEEAPCATKILTALARRAYRRTTTAADVAPLLDFYAQGRKDATFENGIEFALRALLVAPDFLFRIERDPAGSTPGSVHRISDFELASRLSFFLWSSIPDDQLLDLASKGKLKEPAVLDGQVRRMLADPKATALVTNFAGQWLYLRNLASVTPDPDTFPEFNDALRADFQRETELFFTDILREDRSALDLIDADFTYLNGRLARYYGIDNVHGNAFRRVSLAGINRGGLLGQGSILTVTSYPNRTSVVQRGKWILENLLGAPPPPPPPTVPELKSHGEDGKLLTMRQQMEIHRANPTCAGCHSRMDPLGFAMENFNGVGQWRTVEAGAPIDATGTLPDGTKFDGYSGLKKVLLNHRDEFIATLAGKLLTYALGRGLEYYDQPTVRAISREAARDDYRISALFTAIVKSTPFQMRRTPDS